MRPAPVPVAPLLIAPAISGDQLQSASTRGHQRSSEVIRGHPRSSEVIRGHPRSSEVIRDHQRLRFSHRCRSNAVHAQRTARHDAVRCCRQQRQARGRRLQGSVPMEEASEGRKGGRLAPDEGRHHGTIRGNQRRSFMNQSAIRVQSDCNHSAIREQSEGKLAHESRRSEERSTERSVPSSSTTV